MNLQEIKTKLSILSLSAKNDNTMYGNKLIFTGEKAVTMSKESFSVVPFESEFIGMVDYTVFTNFINKITADYTAESDGEVLSLKSGKTKLKLPISPCNGIIIPENKGEGINYKFNNDLADLHLFTNPKSEKQFAHYVVFQNEGIKATNGSALLVRNMDYLVLEEPLYIHIDYIKNIDKMQPTVINVTDTNIIFINDIGFYILPKIWMDYPDTTGFMGATNNNVTFTEGTKEILDRASSFTDNMNTIDISVKDNIMTLSNDNREFSFSETIEVDSDITIENPLNISIKTLLYCIDKFGAFSINQINEKQTLLKCSNSKDYIVVALKGK